MKVWTYKGITAATERQIRNCMDAAIKNANSDAVAEMYREWAYGAFNLWAEITRGERLDEDYDRLRKIANPD